MTFHGSALPKRSVRPSDINLNGAAVSPPRPIALACNSVATRSAKWSPVTGLRRAIRFFFAPFVQFQVLAYTQCPEPGSGPGTCTMHASRVDLGPVLVQLGYLPPPVSNVFVPTPNHSHVVLASDINVPAIWWQVRPVLVLSPSDWPSEDGKTGLNSVKAIVEAIKAGTAVEAPSNFFLFFSSWVNSSRVRCTKRCLE